MARVAKPLIVFLLVSPFLVSPVAAHSEEYEPGDHPDPGLSPSLALFPTPEDVSAALAKHRGHPWVTLHDLGTSKEGRPLRLAEVADPTSPVNRSERVVTFIFTQQHGNEPAGTPAALELLDDIVAGGETARLLENQILLILPMANPDGAAANQRANAMNVDINRDHIALETPEAQLLHRVLNAWDVDVAMDHHEYGGTGLGNPSPVRLYDYDLTTLYPNHGNVREPTAEWSRKLMYEGIWPKAQAAGYTSNEYGEQTVAGVPVEQVAGGPDPGIMRNHLGLHHVVGLLVETRVDAHPNPFQDAARRTALHRTVMDATLEFVHEHAAEIIDAQTKSRSLSLLKPDAEYIEGEARGPIPEAFRVSSSLDDVFHMHGLPSGVVTHDGIVYNLDHELRGHAAAALHPSSSRKLADAVEASKLAWDSAPAQPLEADEALPSPGLLLVFAMVGLGLAMARRRRG